VDLYEYQARQMFKEHGVPVLDYRLASTPEEAREGARAPTTRGNRVFRFRDDPGFDEARHSGRHR